MPLEALINILKPAYAPCANFAETCAGACTWDPERSLVPCAFGGATGELNEVRLVVVTAEPAHPPDTTNYRGGPEDMLIESLRIFDDAMRTGILERRGRPNPFHRSMREVLDAFWPDLDLDAQLRRTWTTNTVLCTARITGGPHLRKVEATCAETYLAPQLALFADAFVLALGDKAKVRMRRAGLRVDADGHHPSSRSSRDIKRASWRAAAERFHHIREAMQLSNDRYVDVERSVKYDTDRKIMRTKPMRTKLSVDINKAIAELPPPVGEFFQRVRMNPDYDCRAMKMQMTVHFRGRKVGGLNRNISQWYLSKVFVRESGNPKTIRQHGFRHVVHNESHEYWAVDGHGSMSAFKNAVEGMTGVQI